MILRDSLRHLALLALLGAAACQVSATPDDRSSATSTMTASLEADDTLGDQAAVEADDTVGDHASVVADDAAGDQAYHRRVCARGIKQCSADQEGQVCNPDDPLFLCSRQDNGGFCCLPFAL
jgi:hypothetical protein